MNARISAAVVGGVNMDIGGFAAGELIERDSNIGCVRVSAGGVGRNIAADLSKMGLDVSLIAAIGGDILGTAALQSCKELGLDMSLALILPHERSSCYLYVNDAEGDMRVGVNDMGIVERITPEYLECCMEKINSCAAAVIDANLSQAAIEYLADNCAVPLYADPVSAVKAPRLKNALPKLAGIKPNALEAEVLTGESDPVSAARSLVKMGVKRVFVSLGARGIIAAQGDRLLRLPCEKVRVVSTTGAGDAAAAAIVYAGIQGLELEEAARYALKAGANACGSVEASING